MPSRTPEGEVLDAHMTAQHAALVALVRCLEDTGALRRGQFANSLHMTMENGRNDLSDLSLALLHGIRQALLD